MVVHGFEIENAMARMHGELRSFLPTHHHHPGSVSEFDFSNRTIPQEWLGRATHRGDRHVRSKLLLVMTTFGGDPERREGSGPWSLSWHRFRFSLFEFEFSWQYIAFQPAVSDLLFVSFDFLHLL